jgi:hypothetical protein
MIEAKQAVHIAKEKAAEMLGQASSGLEEIERETYKDRDVWSITLSFPRDLNQVAPFLKLSVDPLQYKRFLIDVQTGDLLAMKLREVASR